MGSLASISAKGWMVVRRNSDGQRQKLKIQTEMKKYLLQILFTVTGTAGLILTGCNKSSDTAGGNVIKVGEFASLTGKEAAFGNSSHKGTQLAIEDINAAGGVLGKKIELVTEDTRS